MDILLAEKVRTQVLLVSASFSTLRKSGKVNTAKLVTATVWQLMTFNLQLSDPLKNRLQ